MPPSYTLSGESPQIANTVMICQYFTYLKYVCKSKTILHNNMTVSVQNG